MNDEKTPIVHMVRADYAKHAPAFLKGGYVGIGWLRDVDLTNTMEGGKEVLRKVYEGYHPEASTMSVAQGLGQVWRFLTDLAPGTFVATPLSDNSELRVGKITGDYYYVANPTDSPYPHRKPVTWFPEAIKRSSLSVPVQNTLSASLTVFQISQYEEILKPFGIALPEKAKRVLSTEDEINRAILDQILELSADEFEILVKELLTAIGFDAEHVGKPGDGGIDVKGKLRVYEFASVDLMVQVKRYQLKSKISHKDIKDFRGSVPQAVQAAFLTTSDFTSSAREEAEKDGFKKIGLINGNQLVDILIEHYDDLSDEVRYKLNLRKTLIPGTN